MHHPVVAAIEDDRADRAAVIDHGRPRVQHVAMDARAHRGRRTGPQLVAIVVVAAHPIDKVGSFGRVRGAEHGGGDRRIRVGELLGVRKRQRGAIEAAHAREHCARRLIRRVLDAQLLGHSAFFHDFAVGRVARALRFSLRVVDPEVAGARPVADRARAEEARRRIERRITQRVA